MARRRGRGRRRRSSPRRRRAGGGGRLRRFARRARSVKLSLVGKAGLLVATVPAVALPGLSALSKVLGKVTVGTAADLQFTDKLAVGLIQFANEFAEGFGVNKPFASFIGKLDDGTGTSYTHNFTNSVPKGSLLALTGVGTGVLFADVIRSWLLNFASGRGRRGVKAYGVQLTTGR